MLRPASGRRFGRLLTLSLLTAMGLILGVGSASAHVTVNPNTAVAGSYTTLTFRVPNESAKASTVGVTVTFPIDHPFASVSVKKQPGWTATTTTAKLATPISDDDNAEITQAVSSITWKADAGGAIALGEFAEFEVSVGPVPNVATLIFPTTQTYDDRSVVKWDEPTPASGAEPENPAPMLTITASGQSSDGSSGADPSTPAGTAVPSTDSPAGSSSAASGPTVTSALESPASTAVPLSTRTDNAARTLAVIAVVIAAVALLVGVLGLRRRRSRS